MHCMWTCMSFSQSIWEEWETELLWCSGHTALYKAIKNHFIWFLPNSYSPDFFCFTSRQILIHQITSQGQLPAGAVLSEIRLRRACVSHATCQLVQKEAVQMTLNTYQVLDQQEGWTTRCHYVPAIISLSHSPFQFSYSLFKLLNLLFVKAWKINNSINNKSCSRAFYSERS